MNEDELRKLPREFLSVLSRFLWDIMNRLYTCSNEYGVGWKNHCLIVNEHDRIEVIKTLSSSSFLFIMKDLEKYLKDPSNYVKRKSITLKAINPLFAFFSVDPNHPVIHNYLLHYTSSVCFNSYIVENTNYDSYLKEWVGHYDMKLIYRASEHGYTAESFHQIGRAHV